MKHLLPAFIARTTAVELLHTILDLPLLTLALHRSKLDAQRKEDSTKFRVLYNHLLRNESGVCPSSLSFAGPDNELGTRQYLELHHDAEDY